jgi:hypothetical protein
VTCFPAAATATSGADASAGAAMTAGRARITEKKVFIMSDVNIMNNKAKPGRVLLVMLKVMTLVRW